MTKQTVAITNITAYYIYIEEQIRIIVTCTDMKTPSFTDATVNMYVYNAIM